MGDSNRGPRRGRVAASIRSRGNTSRRCRTEINQQEYFRGPWQPSRSGGDLPRWGRAGVVTAPSGYDWKAVGCAIRLKDATSARRSAGWAPPAATPGRAERLLSAAPDHGSKLLPVPDRPQCYAAASR